MQKLQGVMSSLVDTIQGVQVDRLIILPNSNSSAANSVRLVEELKAGIGVDIPEILNRIGRDPSNPNTDSVSDSGSTERQPPTEENDNS